MFYLSIGGRKVNVYGSDPTDEISPVRSVKTVAPDYIHSMHAAFCQRFIDHWSRSKLPLVTVHDCFGTTLEHVGRMRDELNSQFRLFYAEDHLSAHEGYVKFSTGSRFRGKPPFAKNRLNPDDIGRNRYLFS